MEGQSRSLRPLLRVEYEQLVALGRLADEQVELVQGRMVTMRPQGGRHVAVVRRLATALRRQVPPTHDVSAHSPLALGALSMPEPDVSVTPVGPDREYPRDPILVAEVADSSLAYDLRVKVGLYAAAGVPIYWLVDLTRDEVRVHTGPTGEGELATYAEVTTLRADGVLRIGAFPAVELVVDDLLRSR
jgi:Uma2 family endonuclease